MHRPDVPRGTVDDRDFADAEHLRANRVALADPIGPTRSERSGGSARSGRARRINAVQRLELLALACEPAEAQGRAIPTLNELVNRAVRRRVVTQTSRSHMLLLRILLIKYMRPHRVRQWLHSPDPQFREKVNAI